MHQYPLHVSDNRILLSPPRTTLRAIAESPFSNPKKLSILSTLPSTKQLCKQWPKKYKWLMLLISPPTCRHSLSYIHASIFYSNFPFTPLSQWRFLPLWPYSLSFSSVYCSWPSFISISPPLFSLHPVTWLCSSRTWLFVPQLCRFFIFLDVKFTPPEAQLQHYSSFQGRNLPSMTSPLPLGTGVPGSECKEPECDTGCPSLPISLWQLLLQIKSPHHPEVHSSARRWRRFWCRLWSSHP